MTVSRDDEFDEFEEGRRLRDTGMEQTLEAEGRSAYRIAAQSALDTLIATRRPFSANEVQERLRETGLVSHHPATLGALFGWAAKRGLIRRCGTTRARKATSHARLYPVWISVQAPDDELSVLKRKHEQSLEILSAVLTVVAEKANENSSFYTDVQQQIPHDSDYARGVFAVVKAIGEVLEQFESLDYE